MQLRKLDRRKTKFASDEILCVAGVRNELQRLPYFLEYYRARGVHRFLILDNSSVDGSQEYLLAQPDCHLFETKGSHFANNIWPPRWTNAVLNVYCAGHWCVVVDGDELLVYPHSETVGLRAFCRFMDETGAEAMAGFMVDMYGDGPLLEYRYSSGQDFLVAAPFFDPKPGWIKPLAHVSPPYQMFGGVRERVFWTGRFQRTLPPCLSKVPVVKWKRGMKYHVAQHIISPVRLTHVQAALLHFKFLMGMELRAKAEVDNNKNLAEKSLEERTAYLEALQLDPLLSLRNTESVAYRNSEQLVRLGWIRSCPSYENFCRKLSGGWSAANEIQVASYVKPVFQVVG